MAIITIGGNIGTGKTTLAGRLANTLGYEYVYVAKTFRDLAKQKGLSIDDFYAEMKNNPKLERETDERQAKLMREKDNLVVQGRIAWYFAKLSPFQVFNILLVIDPMVGAERVAQRPESKGKTVREVARGNIFRETTERERYKMLYDIQNHLDPKHYDFMLDTTKLTEAEVFKKVISKIRERLEADV